jgi:hypothetical protein
MVLLWSRLQNSRAVKRAEQSELVAALCEVDERYKACDQTVTVSCGVFALQGMNSCSESVV